MSDYIAAIPSALLKGLERYVKYGVRTGSFLRACLENDFMEAIGQADEFSRAALREIAIYIHWDIPASCHGSPEKVKAWLARDWSKERAHYKDG